MNNIHNSFINSVVYIPNTMLLGSVSVDGSIKIINY